MPAVQLECPGCGRPVNADQKMCSCGAPLNIISFSTFDTMPMPMVNKYANSYRKALALDLSNTSLGSSLAMCYLKLRLYDKAIEAFDKVMDDFVDNPETYFWAAVARLRGQNAFVADREDIDRIVEYINASILIEPKGIYYFFLAYIKYDYFERKYLNTTPNYKELLIMVASAGVSNEEKQRLFSTLNVPIPELK